MSRPLLGHGVQILERSSGLVQIGWYPEDAVICQPPPGGVDSAALRSWLRGLDGTRELRAALAAALELRLDPVYAAEVLHRLAEVGLVEFLACPGQPARRVQVIGQGPLTDALKSGLMSLGARVLRTSGSFGDFVILADTLVVDPVVLRELHRATVPYLHVRVQDGRGVVGPLVFPGTTSCLRCADLFRTDRDEDWPYLAVQLMSRTGYASPSTVAATAALALDQVEALCSCQPMCRVPACTNATLEVNLRQHALRRRRWERHPACPCQ